MGEFKGLVYIQKELRNIRIEVRTENNKPGGYPVIVILKDDLPGFEYVLQESRDGTHFGFAPDGPDDLFQKIEDYKKKLKEESE